MRLEGLVRSLAIAGLFTALSRLFVRTRRRKRSSRPTYKPPRRTTGRPSSTAPTRVCSRARRWAWAPATSQAGTTAGKRVTGARSAWAPASAHSGARPWGCSLGFADKGGAPAAASSHAIWRPARCSVRCSARSAAASPQPSKNDAEHVLFGASIGVIAGAGLGIVTGIVEGQAKRRRQEVKTTTTTSSLRLAPTLGWMKDARGSTALVPGLSGSF